MSAYILTISGDEQEKQVHCELASSILRANEDMAAMQATLFGRLINRDIMLNVVREIINVARKGAITDVVQTLDTIKSTHSFNFDVRRPSSLSEYEEIGAQLKQAGLFNNHQVWATISSIVYSGGIKMGLHYAWEKASTIKPAYIGLDATLKKLEYKELEYLPHGGLLLGARQVESRWSTFFNTYYALCLLSDEIFRKAVGLRSIAQQDI